MPWANMLWLQEGTGFTSARNRGPRNQSGLRKELNIHAFRPWKKYDWKESDPVMTCGCLTGKWCEPQKPNAVMAVLANQVQHPDDSLESDGSGLLLKGQRGQHCQT